MWGKIVEVLLPIAASIIERYFRKRRIDAAGRENWIHFLKKMQKDATLSVKLRKSVDDQLERLKDGGYKEEKEESSKNKPSV